VLELAVAVELVAEEVAEEDGARPHPAGGLRQRGLVDLEEPELGARRGEEGRGDPRDQVRPGGVVSQPEPRPQDGRRHRRRRRLPVRRRDEHRALRELAGQPVDRAGMRLPEHLPGEGRAAAGAEEPRRRADPPGKEPFELEQHATRLSASSSYPEAGALAVG
jgi:hypothetical protein